MSWQAFAASHQVIHYLISKEQGMGARHKWQGYSDSTTQCVVTVTEMQSVRRRRQGITKPLLPDRKHPNSV